MSENLTVLNCGLAALNSGKDRNSLADFLQSCGVRHSGYGIENTLFVRHSCLSLGTGFFEVRVAFQTGFVEAEELPGFGRGDERVLYRPFHIFAHSIC